MMKVIAVPITEKIEEQLRLMKAAPSVFEFHGDWLELVVLLRAMADKAEAAGSTGKLQTDIKGILAYVSAVKAKLAALDTDGNITAQSMIGGILHQFENLIKSLSNLAEVTADRI